MCKLSIIIPIYRVEKFLPACLDSVVRPDRADYEILAVDDGSPDRSGAIAEDYARRYPGLLRVFHQENGGLGAARNAGLAASKGEYVLFLDSDDYLSPGALEEMLAAAEGSADVIQFDYYKVDEQGQRLGMVCSSSLEGRFSLRDEPELLLSPLNAWSKLWRRSLFMRSGIRFPPRLWYEDLATTPGLYLHADHIQVIHRPWICYRQHGDSIMHSHDLERHAEIIAATELALSYFRADKDFDTYAPFLEAFVIKHQLLSATVRVNRIDPASPLQAELLEALERQFPRWRENPYLRSFSARRRLLLYLIGKRRYGTIHTLIALRDRLCRKPH